MESNLRDDQKLFIKSLKGHYTSIPFLREKILEDVYAVHYTHITEHARMNYLINIFVALQEAKSVDMDYNNPISWLLKEIISINTSPLSSKTLELWLRNHITMCKRVEGLDLDVSDEYLNLIMFKEVTV